MRVFSLEEGKPNSGAVCAAARALRRGELVIFPTETVYGLAADAMNEQAVKRVIDAKGRGSSHALPVQIASMECLESVAARVSDTARMLAERFWPGPLTLVLDKSRDVPDLVTGGAGSVGVRIPDHPVALALLREFGAPMVATSANLTGREAPTRADDAVNQLGGWVSVVLDSGPCRIGVASTVVDVRRGSPRILRNGFITQEAITAVTGDAISDP